MTEYKYSTINNGLKVISAEDNNSPIVTVSLWFRTGSRYESEGEWGFSHILEHMLFKGTVKRPSPYAISSSMDRLGAFSNGFTRRDGVFYFIQVAAEHLEIVLELLSDMILHSSFDKGVLDNEKKIILEELYRTEQDHVKSSIFLSFQNLFKKYPLAQHPLGNPKTISSATVDGLKKYHQKFYQPSNSSLIVTGKVNHLELSNLTKKYFSDWENRGVAPTQVQAFHRELAESYFFKKAKTKQHFLVFNFLLPDATSSLALSSSFAILENYLGYGQSSVLAEELRHKRGLVYNVNSIYFPHRGASSFMIRTASTKPEESIEIINDILQTLSQRMTAETLEAAKKQEVNAFKRSMGNPFNEFDFLGSSFILFDKMLTPEEYIENIQKVTIQDMLEAIKYLQAENGSIVSLGPKKIKIF